MTFPWFRVTGLQTEREPGCVNYVLRIYSNAVLLPVGGGVQDIVYIPWGTEVRNLSVSCIAQLQVNALLRRPRLFGRAFGCGVCSGAGGAF